MRLLRTCAMFGGVLGVLGFAALAVADGEKVGEAPAGGLGQAYAMNLRALRVDNCDGICPGLFGNAPTRRPTWRRRRS